MKIGIIGTGVMGSMIAQKIKESGLVSSLLLSDKTNNLEVVENSDIIFICVKPQSFSKLAGEISGKIAENKIIISIMAGISLDVIRKNLEVNKIVRTMPNLGIRVGQSLTAWISENLDEGEEEKIIKILEVLGTQVKLEDDDMIDKASVVSGCGPGFLFFIISKWLEATKKLGFSDVQSEKLLSSTLSSSSELLKQDFRPEELVNQVASKGGVTESGLKIMEEEMGEVWDNVFKTAYAKTKELAK